MVHATEDLLFPIKATDDFEGVHTELDQLEGHGPFDGFPLTGEPDAPHSARAEPTNQFVGMDDRTGNFLFVDAPLLRGFRGASGIWRFNHPVTREELEGLVQDIRVGSSFTLKVSFPLTVREKETRFEKLFRRRFRHPIEIHGDGLGYAAALSKACR